LDSLLRRLLPLLPAPLRRRLTPARIAALGQFARFAVVGASGFVVDTLCVYALRGTFGLYGAGVLAWGVAVSTNWVINRVWTFRGQGGGPAHRQFLRYVAVNVVGFVLNRGAYALMVGFVAAAAEEPVLATAAGAMAGMFANFFLSRTMVFR
jgi:putative flippase GtrA